MDKIEMIKAAIERGCKRESQINDLTLSIPMLGSLNIRHLLNNLGALGSHFLDVGPHKGGTTCSTIYKNRLATVTAVDCFASDESNYDKAEPQFLANVSKCLHPDTQFTFIKGDAFGIDLSKIDNPIDLYSYDAGHAKLDQEMALTYYLPVLADEFILCVDDYSGVDGFNDVKEGTQDGIRKCNLEILFEQEFVSDSPYSNDSWWNGYYIALLRKKS